MLIVLLEKHSDGSVCDIARAKVLYEMSVNEDGSMVNLGLLFMSCALGFPEDVKHGVHRFVSALEESGDNSAMFCLGFVLGGIVRVGENTKCDRSI